MESHFPYGMRPTRIAERRQFYQNEFNIDEARQWFRIDGNERLVIDVGTESTRYRPLFKQYLNKLLYLSQYTTQTELREKIRYYVPEDVYYVTHATEPHPMQELVFDLDPEHTYCMYCRMMRKRIAGPTQPFAFCEQCFTNVTTATAELVDVLHKHFTELHIIYSGRGFHIHVHDAAAWQLTTTQRQQLAEKMQKRFPIDLHITAGTADLIRLPGSLNGLVSRKVITVSKQDLDRPDTIVNAKALPAFLEESH